MSVASNSRTPSPIYSPSTSPVQEKISPGSISKLNRQGKCCSQFLNELSQKFAKEKIFDGIEHFLSPLINDDNDPELSSSLEQSSSLLDDFRCRLYVIIKDDAKVTGDDQEMITSIVAMNAFKTLLFPKK
jgi:hypothetical protein